MLWEAQLVLGIAMNGNPKSQIPSEIEMALWWGSSAKASKGDGAGGGKSKNLNRIEKNNTA